MAVTITVSCGNNWLKRFTLRLIHQNVWFNIRQIAPHAALSPLRGFLVTNTTALYFYDWSIRNYAALAGASSPSCKPITSELCQNFSIMNNNFTGERGRKHSSSTCQGKEGLNRIVASQMLSVGYSVIITSMYKIVSKIVLNANAILRYGYN